MKCPNCSTQLYEKNNVFVCALCGYQFTGREKISPEMKEMVKQQFVEEYIDLVRRYHMYVMKWEVYDDFHVAEVDKDENGKLNDKFFIGQIGELMQDVGLLKEEIFVPEKEVMKKIWPGDKNG